MSNSGFSAQVKEWGISILIAVVLACFIRFFIVELYLVEGPSMLPTLENHERLVVNKFIYRFREPERGEVLVFKYPRDPNRDFIKRVIGVAGDTIEIKEGKVYLNDTLLDEGSYTMKDTRTNYPKRTIPTGHLFVMGDNRNNSEDSRYRTVGFVPVDMVKGKAMMVFWPLDAIKTLP